MSNALSRAMLHRVQILELLGRRHFTYSLVSIVGVQIITAPFGIDRYCAGSIPAPADVNFCSEVESGFSKCEWKGRAGGENELPRERMHWLVPCIPLLHYLVHHPDRDNDGFRSQSSITIFSTHNRPATNPDWWVPAPSAPWNPIEFPPTRAHRGAVGKG